LRATSPEEITMTTRTILAVALMIAAIIPAHAEKIGDEYDMVCSGPFRGERVGYCHVTDDETMKIIEGFCSYYQPCVVKARVKLSWINEGYKNYEITHLYSAKKGK
jgi:hypothetical protein